MAAVAKTLGCKTEIVVAYQFFESLVHLLKGARKCLWNSIFRRFNGLTSSGKNATIKLAEEDNHPSSKWGKYVAVFPRQPADQTLQP